MGIPRWSSGLGFRTFTAEGRGSVSGWATKIPQAAWCSQKNKQEKKLEG